ncbi:nucleotidyltransferase domain-containing protein [Metabacillus sp. Hm71]|uniref:nucleotidyltransferase domain-containing protein n=1 Tax=Metabacillus sp. Hm71 TaxID=3450743 RepID=UPI003F435A26
MEKIHKINLEKLNSVFTLKEVYITGSFCKGETTECSDLDMIIISDDFQGISHFKRREIVEKYIELSLPIDAICLTSFELQVATKKSPNFFENEKLEGIKIWG